MSTELLRQAADRLHALADAADPDWFVEVALTGSYSLNAAYIAAMSPTVGKALAAWLREVAPYFVALSDEEAGPALAVARAILGGASS